MNKDILGFCDFSQALVRAKRIESDGFKIGATYRLVARRVDGSIKWIEEVHNTVVNEGLNDILDVYFHSGTQTGEASWFIGLTTGSPTPNSADTLASHGGWTEWTDYTGNRKAWTHSAPSSQQVTNSTAVTFTANSNSQTVGGAFLATVSSGAAGTLFNIAAFTQGNRSLDASESVDVTVTITASSS